VKIKHAVCECSYGERKVCVPAAIDPVDEIMDCGKCRREGLGFEPTGAQASSP
jgi:hypothetical protein